MCDSAEAAGLTPPQEDPSIQRVLLDMHFLLFEWFMVEWLELAPVLVGASLEPAVLSLPEDLCLQEYFALPGTPPSRHYNRLLLARSDFDDANATYSRLFDRLGIVSQSLRRARTVVRQYLGDESVPYSVWDSKTNSERMGRMFHEYWLCYSALIEAFHRRLDVQTCRASLFGMGNTLTVAWFARPEAPRIRDLLA
jgi:hypothetical protein